MTKPIPLKEADPNENTKILAKDTSAAAEKYKILVNEKYGN